MVRIEIETDGAAFEAEAFGPEVARILVDLAAEIEEGVIPREGVGTTGYPLSDANGNTCGRAVFKIG